MKRHCAIRRDARLSRATLRKTILERAQGLAPKMTELNVGFSTLPPTRRGAPIGNRNARKHGARSCERRALFTEIRAHLAEGRALLAKLRPERHRREDTP
jgi:hypothetical protein